MSLFLRWSLSRNECHKKILTAGYDSAITKKHIWLPLAVKNYTSQKIYFWSSEQTSCLVNTMQPKFTTHRERNISTFSTCCSVEFLLLFVAKHPLTAALCCFLVCQCLLSQQAYKTFKCMLVCQKFYSNKLDSTHRMRSQNPPLILTNSCGVPPCRRHHNDPAWSQPTAPELDEFVTNILCNHRQEQETCCKLVSYL